MWLYNIKGRQKEISIFCKLHRESNKNNKNVFTFLILYLLCSLIFIGLHFLQKELMLHYVYTFITFKHVNFGKHIWIYTSKIKKKHARLKVSSRNEVFTRLFFLFFIPRWIFVCLFDRDELIPVWNFSSAKTCKQEETFHHRQGWFHSGTTFIPG